MKVLFINYFSNKGGAAVACNVLFKSLKNEIQVEAIYGDQGKIP